MTASTPDQEAVAIAGKLTKAQREALIAWPDEWSPASAVLGLHPGNIASVLADKGVFERRSDPTTWGRLQYRLTPLGLRVRTVLVGEAEVIAGTQEEHHAEH